jgi:osmotically-inducible protein OsmY
MRSHVEEQAMNTETANETIADAVRRELDWDPKVNAKSLGVTATEGWIVLMGTVSSHAEWPP